MFSLVSQHKPDTEQNRHGCCLCIHIMQSCCFVIPDLQTSYIIALPSLQISLPTACLVAHGQVLNGMGPMRLINSFIEVRFYHEL